MILTACVTVVLHPWYPVLTAPEALYSQSRRFLSVLVTSFPPGFLFLFLTNLQPSGEASSSSHFFWHGMDVPTNTAVSSGYPLGRRKRSMGPSGQSGYGKMCLFSSAVIVNKPYRLECGIAGLMI